MLIAPHDFDLVDIIDNQWTRVLFTSLSFFYWGFVLHYDFIPQKICIKNVF